MISRKSPVTFEEVIDWVQDLREWFERKYEKPAREALLQPINHASESALTPFRVWRAR